MAYMHIKTFELLSGGDARQGRWDYSYPDFDDEYFFVDDMIALPIQVLNRKGYMTGGCCSAHPFSRIRLPADRVPPEVFEEIKKHFDYRSYISFKEGVSLPSLPPGFSVDEIYAKIAKGGIFTVFNAETQAEEQVELPPRNYLVIVKHYSYDNAYAFMREALDAMEQLYQWALSLPDAAKINNGGNSDGVYEQKQF